MRHLLQARKPDEAASAFDRVHKAKDLLKDLAVVGVSLEFHHLAIDDGQALAGFSKEIAKQFIYGTLGANTESSRARI
jgi:hypothetical protein